ncbi:hypothetical protein H7J87_12015 [Mycolicibacterium wolinskyi]|uniref:Uncharacterized protein n=1 Tax=Mycolicibacterium wolinskyi TaxID=59750 RepID=A0A1X2FJ44_9MYCO|nr:MULTISPECIES: hypothetical protein [Mycolicibacterium]MCV7286057.1 hypothetical protein [Mycolicibacterium wolinskyi]MCV7296253.1 hypothetical protein [Mycolicibacterium goodii]ORX18481.1 hypothetical protein AWC31_14355 [Mycolicibacterium wolinskyi]
MNTLVAEAHELLNDLAAGQKRPLERDQSAGARRERDCKVARITAALRAAGMSQKADAVAMYHDQVDRYVDGQQAVDPTQMGSAMRDPGVWLTRIYDHARRAK